MSLFAGAFRRAAAAVVPTETCEEIASALSRDASDRERIRVYNDGRCFIAHLDLGAFTTSGLFKNEAGVLAVSGEPLLPVDEFSVDALPEARGVFCAAQYSSERGDILLVADKLCIRPLYYCITDDFVYFATALRVLEVVIAVPRTMDVRAVSEIASIGYPLASRTPYAQISLMAPAEIISIDEHGVKRSRYWRWESITASQASGDVLLDRAYEEFRSAVQLRLGGDTIASAHLSGGLDSRCVVTALRDAGVTLHTLNFSRPHSQEQVFASEYAHRIQTLHTHFPYIPFGNMEVYGPASVKWREATESHPNKPQRPQVAWSGDGGSVGVGHVYMSPRIVELLRAGDRATAVQEFLQQQSMHGAGRVLRRKIAPAIAEVPFIGIMEELDSIRCADPAQSFYLFLMYNDQRRHLSAHFENLDRFRTELQLPFFDSAFLTTVMAAPLDSRLQHRFYSKWIERFPDIFRAVAWQTYPDHVPCPVPSDACASQWDEAGLDHFRRARKTALLAQAREILSNGEFADPLLRRGVLRFALWLQRWDLRDCSHIIETARVFQRHWLVANQGYVLPARMNARIVTD